MTDENDHERIGLDAERVDVYVPNWMDEASCNEVSKLTTYMGNLLSDAHKDVGDIHGPCICYALANVISTIIGQSISAAQHPGAMAQVLMTAQGITALMMSLSEEVEERIPKDVIKLFGEAQGNA
jgi:hypothetical protein